MVSASPTGDVTNTIRQFVLTTYLQGETPENVPDDLPLQSSGILDSLATLGVIGFIEQQFGITLAVEDTIVERFDSLADMAATVVRKRSGQ